MHVVLWFLFQSSYMIYKTTEGINSVLYILLFDALPEFLSLFPFQMLQDFFFYDFLSVWRTSFSHYLREGLATNSFSFLSLEYVSCLLSLKIITGYRICSGQFSRSVMSTLCSPMDCSMSVFPIHHQLPEFTQTHVHGHLYLKIFFFFSLSGWKKCCVGLHDSACVSGAPPGPWGMPGRTEGLPRAGHLVPLGGEGSPSLRM